MSPFRILGSRALLPIALGIVMSAAAFAQSTGPKSGLEGALNAFKAGEWKKSAQIAADVPADSKDFARAQYVCGEAMIVMGDGSNAEQCFLRVLEKNANAEPAAVGLGRALAAQSKNDEAEKALERAVKMDAKDPLAVLALGQLHLQMKKTKEAKAELAGAFALDPKNPSVVRGWCEWLWAENDNAGSLKAAQDLAKALPKHPMGPFLEAIALERDGKDKKAIDAYEDALARDPNFLDAHKNLAILCHTRNPMYTDAERTQKALEHYKKYFDLGGKDPELLQLYQQFKGFMDQYQGGGGDKGKDDKSGGAEKPKKK